MQEFPFAHLSVAGGYATHAMLFLVDFIMGLRSSPPEVPFAGRPGKCCSNACSCLLVLCPHVFQSRMQSLYGIMDRYPAGPSQAVCSQSLHELVRQQIRILAHSRDENP